MRWRGLLADDDKIVTKKMSLQTSIIQVLLEVGITTISELAKNIVYFILIYLGFKLLAKEIRESAKKVPEWINLYFKEIQKAKTLDKALEGRKIT